MLKVKEIEGDKYLQILFKEIKISVHKYVKF